MHGHQHRPHGGCLSDQRRYVKGQGYLWRALLRRRRGDLTTCSLSRTPACPCPLIPLRQLVYCSWNDAKVPAPTMRQPKSTTDQPARSLLQKAVRRSSPDVVARTLDYLYRVGDVNWLRQRVGVIVSEECWPLLHGWELPNARGRNGSGVQRVAIEGVLRQAALTVKRKDAAGLGSLAYAHSEGDSSTTMHLAPDDVSAIEHVSWGISNTDRFFGRCRSRCSDDNCAKVVSNAQLVHRKRGWPWDMAFTLAAAYLCATTGLPRWATIPEREDSRGSATFARFPFWLALDKHTAEGKRALSAIAKCHRLSPRKLGWVSFYCETGRSSNAVQSAWWDREAAWRFRKVGLSTREAEAIWEDVRQDFSESVDCSATALRARVLAFNPFEGSRELPL